MGALFFCTQAAASVTSIKKLMFDNNISLFLLKILYQLYFENCILIWEERQYVL